MLPVCAYFGNGFRWFAPAAGALVFLLLSATSVRATCGDYLTDGKHAHDALRTGKQDHKQYPQQSFPVPCHGPNCSKSVPPAPGAPLPSAPLRLFSEMILAPEIPLLAERGFGCLLGCRMPESQRFLPDIFHPPRLP